MRTVSERRGGGRNRNNDGMSIKTTRGGRTRTGGNRNADGVRIGKRGKNADGTSKRRKSDASDGEEVTRDGNRMRGGGRGEGKRDVVNGGDGKNRSKTPRAGKNIDGEHPGNSKIKTRTGESMASAVIKAGITLVPIESSTGRNNNGKRKRGNN